jgi:hypothetical protein
MKTQRITILSSGLCLILCIAACKKSNDTMPAQASAGTHPQMARSVPEHVTLDFTGGNMMTSAIGVQDNQNMVACAYGPHTWNFFTPLRSSGLMIPKKSYQNLVTDISMMSMEGNPVLDLHGIMNYSSGTMVMTRNFEFDIMTPINVRAGSGIIEITDGTCPCTLFDLHLDRLLENTTDAMWQQALNGNTNTIVISENSNQQLYQIMLSNLETMLAPYNAAIAPPQSQAVGGSASY